MVAFAAGAMACGGGDDASAGPASGSGGAGASSSTNAATGSSTSGAGGAVEPIGGVRIFFSDLVSGPNTGGENDKGAFVTVWGNGFGATQGSSTVTVGGGAVDSYQSWTETRITFQLGAAAKSGDIVVNVAGKGASNGVPFTVRAGTIRFVSSTGSDANDGSFAKPWATIPQAKNALQPGDIAYIGTSAADTVSQTTEDASSAYACALGMSVNDGANSGTADMPKALVVYPGATGVIGVESGLERGVLTPAISGTFDYWVIAGFSIRGESEAIELEGGATGWRIVGNDISCPNGSGQTGCVTGGSADSPSDLKFFGNVVHDAAANVATVTKYYHGIYFGSNHLELGWNVVKNGKTCRAIQFHDSSGPNNFDLLVHDNLVFGTVCDGINFASVDPSQGPVRAYNNVIYDVGQGPDPSDGSSDYAGIYVANITNQGAEGSGNVEIFDNTFYGCGAQGSSAAGAIARAAGPVSIVMNDNLVVTANGGAYVSSDSDTSAISGSNNLFFGGDAPPAFLTASVSGDPMFVDVGNRDLRVKPGSPAIDAGITTSATTDFDGVLRPQGKAFDIGAFEQVP